MDYFTLERKLEDKLAETLAHEGLLHRLNTSREPITLTIYPNAAPDAQMELYATRDDSISSPDASLQLIFEQGGLRIQTNERLVLADSLLGKIKGIAKKIHYAYVHAEFAASRAGNTYTAPCTADEPPADDDGDFGEFYDEE